MEQAIIALRAENPNPVEVQYDPDHGGPQQAWFYAGAGCTLGDEHCRQVNSYFWMKYARDYLRSNVYLSISPVNSTPLAGVVVGTPGSNSWYNTLTEKIYLRSDASFGTAWHEYGHKFVAHYGGLSQTCNASTHSDSISEAMANIIAMVVARKSVNTPYTNLWGRIGNQDAQVHFAAGSRLQFGDYSCSDGIYEMAGPLEQVMWELLNNLDCDKTTCSLFNATGPDPFSSSQNAAPIGFSSAGQSRVAVARGLAHSLKMMPTNTSYYGVKGHFLAFLLANYGTNVYSNARDVLDHHGFIP